LVAVSVLYAEWPLLTDAMGSGLRNRAADGWIIVPLFLNIE
jgi:hypothetical protein